MDNFSKEFVDDELTYLREMGWFDKPKQKIDYSKDSARLDLLDSLNESYGFENEHHGNRWLIEGSFNNIREALDSIVKSRN